MTAVDLVIAVLVFVGAASIDFANTRYVLAVGRRDARRAGMWSVLQWAASLVGFVVVVKYTLWFLPVEALGLYAGTRWSLREPRTRALG